MHKFWWKSKQYQLKTGKWVPIVYLYEDIGDSVEVTELLAPKGREFDTEAEAKEYSDTMARKWIKDDYL